MQVTLDQTCRKKLVFMTLQLFNHVIKKNNLMNSFVVFGTRVEKPSAHKNASLYDKSSPSYKEMIPKKMLGHELMIGH